MGWSEDVEEGGLSIFSDPLFVKSPQQHYTGSHPKEPACLVLLGSKANSYILFQFMWLSCSP